MMGKKKEITCRRLLMFFLCCMMFLSRPAMESQAEDTNAYTYTDTNKVQYTFYISSNGGNRAVISSVYVPSGIVSIKVPDTVRKPGSSTEYPVVAIGTAAANTYVGAFSTYGKSLVSVELPDSVCEIYQRAFSGLASLTTLSLNGDGIVIGYEAFKGCNKLTNVTFRGTGAVKYISGYAFETGNSRHLDYNEIAGRTDKNSWIGYDATWNNETEWRALVNKLTPFSVSVADDSNRNWEPTFEALDETNGYPNPKQIVSASTYTSDYNAWIRKSAKWVNSDEEKAEIRLDVAYNPLSSKSTNDMAFILDVSGSMYYGYNLIPGSNYSRQFQSFDQVRSVAKALLDLNESGTVYNRVAACTFGYDVKSADATTNPSGTNARGTTRGKAGTTDGFYTDYASFVQWLDRENFLFAANTGYSYGLEESYSLFQLRSNKDRTPSVVFLSDGEPNLGTQGTFPGTSTSGYGGLSTSKLSSIGVTRYSILLGDTKDTTLKCVTLIAGAPGSSNDSTRTYASPDADTLQKAFQAILVAMTENLNLNLSDTAGAVFDVSKSLPPTVTGGSVSLSGVSTSWDFSGTEPRQVYTLIIIQDLKRNSEDNNAFFYGNNMETNLDNAVLADVDIGEILSVASPALSRAYETVTILVDVHNGVAIKKDGTESKWIKETITKTGTYEAKYRKDSDSVLENIKAGAAGESVLVDTSLIEDIETSYTVEDIRCNYDIYVRFWYPPTTQDVWHYRASVENGTVSGQTAFGTKAMVEGNNIPLNKTADVKYSTEDGYELEYIIIGIGTEDYKLDEDQSRAWQASYQFPKAYAGEVHTIFVKYKEIPVTTEDKPDEEKWGDYRR